jgi:hypothetical protein
MSHRLSLLAISPVFRPTCSRKRLPADAAFHYRPGVYRARSLRLSHRPLGAGVLQHANPWWSRWLRTCQRMKAVTSCYMCFDMFWFTVLHDFAPVPLHVKRARGGCPPPRTRAQRPARRPLTPGWGQLVQTCGRINRQSRGAMRALPAAGRSSGRSGHRVVFRSNSASCAHGGLFDALRRMFAKRPKKCPVATRAAEL